MELNETQRALLETYRQKILETPLDGLSADAMSNRGDSQWLTSALTAAIERAFWIADAARIAVFEDEATCPRRRI